jgi:hypothetical protein
MRKIIFLCAVISLFGTFGSALVNKPVLAESTNTSNIIVQPIIGPSIGEKLAQRTKASWPWYVTRASGLVAAVSLVLLMVSGIGQVTGYTFRFLEPLTAWATHRALGITFAIAVFLHIFALLFDHFAPFTIWQVLIPWLSNYKPATIFGLHVGTLYVALGVLAFYGVIIVVLSSYIWLEKKPALWKLLHLLSYIIMLFVFIHSLYLGTDLVHGVFRWIWIISGYIVIAVVVHRLYRARTT